MATYGAYDAGLPCKNPNCKSHGRPHPNCQCYGGDMAEGGEMGPFCSQNRAHDPGCEFFSEGGPVGTLHGIDPMDSVAGHVASGGLCGILKMSSDLDIDKYERSVKKGHKNIDSEVERAFNNEKPAKEDRSKNHKFIEDWIGKGGITNDIQQETYNQNSSGHFAGGGAVNKPADGVLSNHPIEAVYPDQNIILNAAKGRAGNYLNSLKPQEHAQRLPFDDKQDQTEQKKLYKRAMKIADHPLSVLHEIAHGTITPEHVKHLNGMYPEVHNAIQKKITEKIIHAQLSGKKPPRKIRQGLSLLMGAALSSDLTPAGINAAQAVFASKAPEATNPQSGGGPSGSKAKLSNSDKSYLTGPQTLVSRQQKI